MVSMMSNWRILVSFAQTLVSLLFSCSRDDSFSPLLRKAKGDLSPVGVDEIKIDPPDWSDIRLPLV